MTTFIRALLAGSFLAPVIIAAAPVAAHDAPTDATSAVAGAAASPASADWVARSNQYTQQLLEMQAQFQPEGASQAGLEQFDGLAMDLGPKIGERYVAASRAMQDEFKAALARETDPNLKQDLAILIASLQQDIDGTQISDRLMLDWYDVPQMIFGNINSLLDDQVAPERRAKARELLERYTGIHPGTTPLTELAKARFADSRADGKIGPYRGDLDDTLPKIPTYIAGIRELFAKYDIAAPEALDALERQLTEYGEWESATIVPLARDSFRLPEELYAFRLRQVGIDIPPQELIERARRGFYETRAQMEMLAPQVAAKLGLPTSDYPSVITALKQDRIPQDQLEARYAQVLAQLEEVIRREKIISLPDYPVLMRLGSEAENAASPAPHMLPPRLIGNTGERGQFVLTTGPATSDSTGFDDFNFAAAAWTLSAHEGRPGHELQFAQMVERGVSQARILYAFNSTNAEGWALYTEAEMLPHEPVEGQLIALQHRLLRAARAMLDPMLNLGLTDVATAERVLRDEARFSPAMVKQEVDRYTFRMPGQAGSYFYGYGRLLDIRMEAELALGDKFDRMAFNDFVVGQGLLPLDLLAQAVREQFVPAQRGR
ncbi:DUF885 family protein [Altererythrobacter xixiisoli]|uniref:DUF885 family protein n=1 Tax=Croceibacterium xixiisoli TaxID=1476466 RepID=A0A6I4TUB7_9SPHN|nr:DUF885 domain-containing protein [Croceibacterium xixiisoli]MXO98800.1 DUF885 family protein [Croceibacterium xixiisoli]